MKRVILTALLALGCGDITQTVATQAAFDLGCDAEQIEVSDLGGGGWGAHGCGKRASYHCGAGQCGKVGETSVAPVASSSAHEPPKGAVGFSFGATLEATRTACTSAGKTWDDASKSPSCSGSLIDIGIATHVGFGFCSDRLCTITVESSGPELEANVGESYTSILDGLTKKYGTPAQRAHHIADACCSAFPCAFRSHSGADADPLAACAKDGRATFDTGWTWPKGEAVHLLLDRAPGTLTMRIVYSVPANAVRPNVEGL